MKASVLAILCLCAGIAIFSVQDLILKLLSDRYPLSEAMVLRSLAAIPCLLVLVRVFDGGFLGLVSASWPMMLWRGFLNFLAYTAYYLALATLPIATTVALYFTAPLFITLLAVLWLGERVALHRWLALGLGFLGVVIMVRPGGTEFDWAALLPVFCGLAYAVSMVMARRMGQQDSAAAMAFWGNLAFLGCSLGLALAFGRGTMEEGLHPSLSFLTRAWVWPSGLDAGLMALCGLIAAVGLTLLTQAYRIGSSAMVAPFEFTFAFWGVLWGWLFFDQLPDAWGWVGIAVIIAAGTYVVTTERPEA
ncbi:DMT family transporter [Rhodobacter sp. KR11]|jgi:drug/metabolite transporter (DMT)-like permease|uniref:DMT family transporter n=1 Tax=Rhodobacter sp. KR11 TaxID=2974588 RepID=UPI0022223AD6|nr:DMT family transporter [Rhodobacter sp. KR11]MCW1917988.1 DMT family transporter [Rhodobacter sp. KR11]